MGMLQLVRPGFAGLAFGASGPVRMPRPAGLGGLTPGDSSVTLTTAQLEAANDAKVTLSQNPDGTPNPVKGAVAGMSDENVGRVLTGVGQVIGSTLSTVTEAIRAGSAERIAEIENATRRYIADRQAAARAGDTQAPADAANAAQLASALEQLRIERLRNQQPRGMSGRTMLYVGGAAVAVGLAVYLLTRKGARGNPVVIKGARRLFVSRKHLDKWLDDGFRVVKPYRRAA